MGLEPPPQLMGLVIVTAKKANPSTRFAISYRVHDCNITQGSTREDVEQYVTRFGKTCLYVRIIFFLIYSLKLSVTAYLSYGASFDATLSMVLTI